MGPYPNNRLKNKVKMGKYTVVHKKSNVLIEGVPKLPSASTLEYGEIAINYAQSGETLSIRNSADQVVPFPSKPTVEKMINEHGGGLPAVTASDNGKVLMVENGVWGPVMPSTLYTGNDVPLSSVGVDGDIYLQTT